MGIRRRRAPLILLLLPALIAVATADAPNGKAGSVEQLAGGDPAAAVATAILPDAATLSASPKPDPGTKDAPVDGKDGKPKLGPFVDSSASKKQPNVEELKPGKKTPLKTPSDKAYDAAGATPEEREQHKLLMEAQESVMDDPNREAPKVGTTGTEGGVSEKDRLRKEQESSKAGPADVKRPETPKEAPPLAESDETKAMKAEKEKLAKPTEEDEKKGAIGLEVRCLLL